MSREAGSPNDHRGDLTGASVDRASARGSARRVSADTTALEKCTDSQLIALVAVQDAAAFATFFDRHANRVMALAVRLLGHRADAEDVVQEVFWQVWRTAARYQPQRAQPIAWLMAIASSRAIDGLRSRGAASRCSVQTNALETISGQDEPLTLRLELQSLLERLSAEQKQVIEMAFLEGRTHVEIAARENLPLGTVKTRIALGMRRLRGWLAEWREEGKP